jgi:ABC-type antimicrobial peptide transport system permease subunit
MDYVVRAGAISPGLLSSLRAVVDTVDRNLALAQLSTLEERLDRASTQPAFNMLLLTIAASVGLVLGLIGIYGVVSYIVSHRTNEIGVRLALGATPRGVAAMVVRQSTRVTMAGIAVGLAVSLGTGRLIESLLYGVSPRDPAILAIVAVLLLAVAVMACWLPARRASRVSPVQALRTN